MLATFDVRAVRNFAAELDTRRATCSNDEGRFCSDLDEVLASHVAVCAELRHAVSGWAREVFSGRVTFDPEVEAVFKAELQRTLKEARPLVEYGRSVETECFSLERLDTLEVWVADFDILLKNWISPQRSVAPAPRVSLGEPADKQIRERVLDLPPLPEGWRPVDRRQARVFDRRPKS